MKKQIESVLWNGKQMLSLTRWFLTLDNEYNHKLKTNNHVYTILIIILKEQFYP